MPALGGDPPARLEHDEHILDGAVLERVGQLDAVAISGVAFGIDDDDIALGDDLSGLAVPDDLVGAEAIAAAVQPDSAARGDDVVLIIIIELIGVELDFVGIGRGRLGRRGRGLDGAVLQVRGGHVDGLRRDGLARRRLARVGSLLRPRLRREA